MRDIENKQIENKNACYRQMICLFFFSLPLTYSDHIEWLVINCMAVVRAILKRDEHFLSFIAICILFAYLLNDLKRRSLSPPPPPPPPPFLLSHSYRCVPTHCVHHNHLFVIYIHRTYIMHRRSIIIAQVKEMELPLLFQQYICIRPTLMQATSSLSHLF